MTLVESYVWIVHLRGHRTSATVKLEAEACRQPFLSGDLILLEILQGARSEDHAARIERTLRRFPLVSPLNPDIAVRAAQNYRTLRGLGVTVRKTADMIIGASCIEHRHTLLHDDRDFALMD